MSDFVISAADLPTLQAAAVQLGFWDAATGNFIAQGPVPGDRDDPLASYFLNIVGEIPQTAGYWARLRINGNNPFASGLLTIPPTLTVYSLVIPPAIVSSSPQSFPPTVPPIPPPTPFWSIDGVTLAPSYVADVGVIA